MSSKYSNNLTHKIRVFKYLIDLKKSFVSPSSIDRMTPNNSTFDQEDIESIKDIIEEIATERSEYEGEDGIIVSYISDVDYESLNDYINDTFDSIIEKLDNDKHYFIEVISSIGGKSKLTEVPLSLNNSNIKDLRNMIQVFYQSSTAETHDKYSNGKLPSKFSDAMEDFMTKIDAIKSIKIKVYDKKRSTNAGRIFPYRNTSKKDLSRYQIYKTAKDFRKDNNNCLIHVLNLYGIDTSGLMAFLGDNKYFSGLVPISRLTDIANILNITIKLVRINDNSKTGQSTRKYYTYGSNTQIVHNIALYLDHYFILEKTQYKYNLGERIARVDSLWLIHHLSKKGKFVKDLEFSTFDKDYVNKTETYQYNINEQVEFKCNYKHKEFHDIIYADTEAYFKDHTHHSFMFGSINRDGTKRIYTDNFENWLRELNKLYPNKEVLVYFHNLKYDWYLNRDTPNMNVSKVIVKNGSYYGVSLKYKNTLIELRDSYKLISEPLRKFKNIFGLDEGKQEYTFYELYNDKNYNKVNVLGKLVQNIVVKEGDVFYDCNAKKTNYNKEKQYYKFDHCYIEVEAFDGTRIPQYLDTRNTLEEGTENSIVYRMSNDKKTIRFFHTSYYRYYLYHDCLTLRDGLEKFNELMQDILKIDSYQCISLSSLVHRAAANQGVYDGVYQVYGSLQTFIQESAHGGRVATRYNKKVLAEGIIQDFDGVSQYPSAMYRIGLEGGYPKGKCSKFYTSEFNNVYNESNSDIIIKELDDLYILSSLDHYVVEVLVHNNTKEQQIAFPCIIEDGKRVYTNMIKDKRMIIDKNCLEDWVEYCGLECTILGGVYWNNGRNDKIKDFIYTLFNQRKDIKDKMKSKDITKDQYKGLDSKQTMIKLALNSVYGKTLLKRPEDKLVNIHSSKIDKYVDKNISLIKQMELHGDNYLIKLKHFDYKHKNMCHIGGMILSMAKRLMNEVMSIADDLNIPIYYTDTDSMHILDKTNLDDESNITKLCKEYKKIYYGSRLHNGGKLYGSNLGQFHNDFVSSKGNSVLHSRKLIALGKKAYMDVLVTKDKNNVIEEEYHVRLKAVNSNGLSEYPNKEELYTKLYNGEKIAFDLTYNNGVNFILSSSGIQTRTQFIRNISF